MRKHNRKFATRFGSARLDPSVPQLSHQIVNSKGFQYAANNLPGKLMRSLGITKKAVI